jgi:hypothetical protein
MRSRYVRISFLATALVASLFPPVAMASPSAAEEATGPGGCTGMTVEEENHSSIRLQVDEPASGAQAAVDEHGKITITGILHKQATMLDVSDGQVTSADFVLGEPPAGVSEWASSWTTSLRPPHLGANKLCARAIRDPERSARILRSFTAVDLIPPSAVPDLAVGNITSSGATVTWGPATDNYGLAGYAVTVDGGTPHRTVVGVRSYRITGLAPLSSHTVSVVAIDLGGNSSTPATTSFTTTEPPPPPSTDLQFDPEQGVATATWHPDLFRDVSYRTFLDGQLLEEFPLDKYCLDAAGNPASPCTAQDVISYPIAPLEQATTHTFQFDALGADGTTARRLSGSFTTMAGLAVVPAAFTQQVASESSQCAGMGGHLYVTPTMRNGVPIPAGATQLFPGCYTVANNSCLDAFLPPSGNKLVDCADDITRLLFAVAPAGHGPVISSLEGVVDYAVPPGVGLLPAQTITWCAEGACAVIVAEAAEAVEVAAASGAAAASFSWLAVIGGGIGLGLVLGVVIAILFPTEIGIAGLLEYPIHFNDDFDTFDNWDLNKGRFHNSLQIYAEVVKTTKLLASEHNIPFAWNDARDQDLKRTIDRACAAQQGRPTASSGACSDGFAVYVPGGLNYQFRPMNQTGNHIVAAMSSGSSGFPLPQRVPWFYPAYSQGGRAATSAGFARNWFDRAPFTPNVCTTRVPVVQACDEFPFFSTDQAVTLSGVQADILPTPRTESNAQGNDLSQFYSQCKVNDTDRFIVLPIGPWVAASGPSFGFRVSPGGTSLCLSPRP